MAKKSNFADLDGRVRTSYLICGTNTFRTSTRRIEPPVRDSSYGLAFQNITKHSVEGQDIRSIFMPSEGYAFVEADQSQAESRIALLLAEEYELLKKMDEIDLHCLTASWINNSSYEQELANYQGGINIFRQIGKHSGHAYDNGVGKRRLVELIYHHSDGEIIISEWKAGKILETLYKYKPNIKNVFHKGIQDVLKNNNCTIITPFGDMRTFYDRFGEEMFKDAYAFIKQAIVTRNTQRAALEIMNNASWIRILVELHDSLLFELPVWRLREGIEIIRAAFQAPIDFSRCSLPRGMLTIPCDIMISLTSWADLIKEDKFFKENP